MTYRSLHIEQHVSRESALAPYVIGSEYTPFGSLNAWSFPISAEAWARKHDHAISYVDNAWARIAVDGQAFLQFLVFGSATEPDYAALIAAIDDGLWYVINEEDF